jgi:hypothetical protein
MMYDIGEFPDDERLGLDAAATLGSEALEFVTSCRDEVTTVASTFVERRILRFLGCFSYDH